jgi:hypothetical protein
MVEWSIMVEYVCLKVTWEMISMLKINYGCKIISIEIYI